MAEEQHNNTDKQKEQDTETTAEDSVTPEQSEINEQQDSPVDQDNADDQGSEAEGSNPTAEDASNPEEDDPQAQIEALNAKLVEMEQDVLRAHAEAQNARRRSETEVTKARKFALERFVSDLLPVVDNLERALDAIPDKDGDGKAVADGIELTLKSFIDTLQKNQVEQIDPTGQPFDPEFHQAMSMVPNGDMEPNTVMTTFQKGYQLNGRLIRPAMVVVSKNPD